jgi:hypothetical protein
MGPPSGRTAQPPRKGRRGPCRHRVCRYNVSFRFPRALRFAQRIEILVQDCGPKPADPSLRTQACGPKPGRFILALVQALFERPSTSAPDGIKSACAIMRIIPRLAGGVTVLNFVFTRIVNHCVTVYGTARRGLPGGIDGEPSLVSRLRPTPEVEHERPRARKTAPVQYLRAIHRNSPRGSLRTGIRFC